MQTKRNLIALCTLLALCLSASILQANTLRDTILQPQRTDIALCQAGLIELQRQADVKLKEHEEWHAFYQQQREALTAKANNLIAVLQTRVDKAEQALATLGSLSLSGQQHLPHFGWHTAETLTTHINELRSQLADAQQKIQNGDYQFHIQAIGWVTGKQLDEKIAHERQRMADLQQSLDAGEWQVHLPALGWVTRNALEARIGANEKRIAETLATIEAGEYQVHIETIGWVTGNALRARIAALEAEMQSIRGQFEAGTFQIHRPLLGWQTAAALEQQLTNKQTAVDEYEQAIADDTFQPHFPTGGWLNGQAVKAKISSLDTTMADIKAAVAEGSYTVPVEGHGWLNREQINEALSRPNLKADAARKLRNGLADIQTASALDIALHGVDKDTWTSWLPEFLNFAQPWLKAKALDIAQFARHQGDYAEEQAFLLQQKQRELDHLNACLAYIP